MRRSFRGAPLMLAAALCLTTFGAERATAGLIYDNLASETYTPVEGYTVSGADSNPGEYNEFSETFTAGLTSALSEIQVAMWYAGGDRAFTLTLADSDSNVLETWTADAASFVDLNTPVVSLISLLHPVLMAGMEYTLTAAPGSSTTWVAWEFKTNTLRDDHAGFRVVGATAVPEPTSLALLGLGVAAVLGHGWRRRAVA